MSALLIASMTKDQHTIQKVTQRVPRGRLASWRGSGKDGLRANGCRKQVRSA